MKTISSIFALLLAFVLPSSAEQFGDFTYSVTDGEITITYYPTSATGPVEIPAEIDGLPVTMIGNYAFYGCTGLTSITIPEGVTSIGGLAFSGCTGLTSVTIPEGVTVLGEDALYGCTGLTSIEVDALNPSYRSLAGVLFDKDLRRLIQYPAGKAGDYTIPGSVTVIESSWAGGAFEGCTSLTSVTIPEGILEVSQNTFTGCRSLVEFDVAPSNQSYVSLNGVVFDRDRTTLVVYPPGRAGSYRIPDGVVRISGESSEWGNPPRSGFDGCDQLTAIILPASFAEFPVGSAFGGCSRLATIEVEEANAHFASVDGVLFNKDLTSLLRFPPGKAGDYRIPAGVTEFYQVETYGWAGPVGTVVISGFWGCMQLTSIQIPVTLAEGREGEAFWGCQRLEAINVDLGHPLYVSRDGVLFNADMTELLRCPEGKRGTYRIPDGVRRVDGTWSSDIGGSGGIRPFADCKQLTSIVFPASIEWIGNHVVSGCDRLVSAIFLGNAPGLGSGGYAYYPAAFSGASPDFSVFYLSSNEGFSSPIWKDYPSVVLDEITYSAAPWLVSHGLPQDTDIHEDLNGDGVSLLMAYALDLDPNAHLQSMMPTPVVNGSSLSLSFHAAAPGITYRVETSTDLQHWTTEGVALSDLDPNQHRTASLPIEAPRRYLRLVVSEDPGL